MSFNAPTIRLSPSGTHFILQTKGEMGVEIPVSATGALILQRLLISREMSPRPKIGTPSFPTQHLINQWAKEDQARRAAEARESAKRKLAEYDLQDLDIDL